MHPSKSCQDLIQAERPGFPAGLRVRAGIDASAVRVRPGRFRSPGSSSRPHPAPHIERGRCFLVPPPPVRHALAHGRDPPSSSQVLLVMKDSARSTPAKKLLEDIGYKGASTAPRATRRDRDLPRARFSREGWCLARVFFPSRGTPGRERAPGESPRARPGPPPPAAAPPTARAGPRGVPIARVRDGPSPEARARPRPPARADRGDRAARQSAGSGGSSG